MSAPLGFRLREAMKMLGARRFLTVAPRWLLVQDYTVGARRLDAVALPPPPLLAGLRVADLGEEQIPRIANRLPGLDEAEIRRRIAEGQRCRVGWLDGAPAHIRWDSVHDVWIPFLGLTVRPLPGDLYSGFAFTDPNFRGRRIHAAVTARVLADEAAAGRRRAIALWADWNEAAIRVSRDQAGRAPVGGIRVRRLGPWRRQHLSGWLRRDGDVFWLDESAPL